MWIISACEESYREFSGYNPMMMMMMMIIIIIIITIIIIICYLSPLLHIGSLQIYTWNKTCL